MKTYSAARKTRWTPFGVRRERIWEQVMLMAGGQAARRYVWMIEVDATRRDEAVVPTRRMGRWENEEDEVRVLEEAEEAVRSKETVRRERRETVKGNQGKAS